MDTIIFCQIQAQPNPNIFQKTSTGGGGQTGIETESGTIIETEGGTAIEVG